MINPRNIEFIKSESTQKVFINTDHLLLWLSEAKDHALKNRETSQESFYYIISEISEMTNNIKNQKD